MSDHNAAYLFLVESLAALEAELADLKKDKKEEKEG